MKKANKDKEANANTNNKVKTTVIVSILLLSVFTATTMLSVVALPEGEHQFWGVVTVNGPSAPDGTNVVAKIGEEVRGSTTTIAGTYGVHSYFAVTGTSGDSISFYVNDIYAANHIFESKGTDLLDLSVTGDIMPDLNITEKWVWWPDNCTICYNVTNTGNGTAPAGHNTTLYVDCNETAHDQVPVDLALGESYVGCFDDYAWVYTQPEDNITVCADNNETVGESDEGNNCLTNIWKCGDVDGDGSITTWDVGLLNARRWDPSFVINEWAGDVDGGGSITTWDVGLLNARRWISSFPLSCKCQQV